MNQLFSPQMVLPEGAQNLHTASGLIGKISNQEDTKGVLDCLWEQFKEFGSSGFAYFHSNNTTKATGRQAIKQYYYGNSQSEKTLIRMKYDHAESEKKSDIDFLPTDDYSASKILCTVFGPYNSKGVFIIECNQTKDQVSDENLDSLNYTLVKSQIHIAEIEAKQKIESISLSARETQVLELLIAGESNKNIALDLGVSVHTVNGYVRFLMLKLNVNDRVSACMVGLSILQ